MKFTVESDSEERNSNTSVCIEMNERNKENVKHPRYKGLVKSA